MAFRVFIPPLVEGSLRHLHPGLKKKIKEALKLIEDDPYIGKPLKGKLTGMNSFRATHYRIVYRIVLENHRIEIADIGPRKSIYEKIFNWKFTLQT